MPFLIADFYAKRCGSRYTMTAPIGRNLTRKLIRTLPFALLAVVVLSAQQRVTVRVDVSKPMGRFEPVWAWVGHDEPNYTYSEEGRELLTRLARLSAYPIHDRTHNLLNSGDGTPALKWGSTNAFARDAYGKPVYNWSIVDQIFDTYQATGITPLVEIGFMPEALSPHSEPYRHHWPKDFDNGWAYPPNNYQDWSDLIYSWVRHMADRYGTGQVALRQCGGLCRMRVWVDLPRPAPGASGPPISFAPSWSIVRAARTMRRGGRALHWISFRFTRKDQPKSWTVTWN